MQLLCQLHAPLYTSSVKREYGLDAASQFSPAKSIFKETGQALPVGSNLEILKKQKKVLHNIFIEGEAKGKKTSPEQVEKILR